MLTDDHPRHALEYFARSPDRPSVELRRGHGALTGGRGDANQALGWILHVDDVAEGTCRGNEDVSVERQSERIVGRHGVSGGDANDAPQHAEVAALIGVTVLFTGLTARRLSRGMS
jgi:hypothetical protein